MTANSIADGYVCRLDAKTEKKAKEELNEDPKDRMGAVEALRTWIDQQPHITFNRDILGLLYFLRTSKFSQLAARERIENYTKITVDFPEWFRNIDTHNPDLLDVIDSGYVCPLPKKDKNGCQILLYRLASLTKKNGEMITVTDEVRAASVVGYWAAQDENVQVNGFVFIMDMTGVSPKHMTRWSMDDMKKWMTSWEKAMPGRFKEFHYYNFGTIFEAMIALCKPFLSKKIEQRMRTHNTMEDMYKSISMDLLPTEYLPDDYKGPSAGSLQTIRENFKKEVMKPEFRELLLQQTSPSSVNLDESKRPAYKAVKESFRKLAVD